MTRTDRWTDRHTHDNYSNPRCACAPRVNKYLMDVQFNIHTIAMHSTFVTGERQAVARILTVLASLLHVAIVKIITKKH